MRSHFRHLIHGLMHGASLAGLLASTLGPPVLYAAAPTRYSATLPVAQGAHAPTATTMTVNTLTDERQDNTLCSLREAIENFNQAALVYDECANSWDGEPVTINLPAGTYNLTLTATNEDDNFDGDLDVYRAGTLTLAGAGAATTIINRNFIGSDRLLHITTGPSNLTLNGLTIQNGDETDLGGALYFQDGSFTATNVTFQLNTTAGAGGAVYVNNGSVNLTNTNFYTNTSSANDTGGLYSNSSGLHTISGGTFRNNRGLGSGQGGGLFLVQTGSTVHITGTQFISNTAQARGGGVRTQGRAFITNTTFINNVAVTGEGGGLSLTGVASGNGSIVKDSVFIGNQANGGTAGFGAGLYTNARITLDNVSFYTNTAQLDGGGVHATVPLTVTNSWFQNNSSLGTSRFGGGLYAGNTLSLTGTRFFTNTAPGGGGGLRVQSNLTMTNVLLQGNTCAGTSCTGGGLYVNGTSHITGTTFQQNTAFGGGGLYVVSGTTTLTNTLFSGNTANLATTNAGGGAYFASPSNSSIHSSRFVGNFANSGWGGGLAIVTGTVTIANSSFENNSASVGGAAHVGGGNGFGTGVFSNTTIYANTASSIAGGVRVGTGALARFINATIANNTAPNSGAGLSEVNTALQLTNTLIANNDNTAGIADDCAAGNLVINTNNLIEFNSGCVTSLTADPAFGPPANTGLGGTLVLPLQVGSPAIDAGTNTGAPATDQRGITRPKGLRVDIGAFETVFAPGGIIANMVVWLKADGGVYQNAGLTPATHGSPVLQWHDFSSNVLTQAQIITTTNITYLTNVANYNPVVQFGGNNLQRLVGTGAAPFANAATLFIVFKDEGTPSARVAGLFASVDDPAPPNRGGQGIFLNSGTLAIDGVGAFGPNTANTTTPTGNNYRIVTGRYITGTNTQGSSIYLDGALEETQTAPGAALTPGAVFEIGGRTWNTTSFPDRIFKGQIAEVVYYAWTLTPEEQNKVESYLAIKYGLTLATAVNYIDSNATVLWNSSANAAYHNDVAGIGVDIQSALVQLKSRSIYTDDVVIMTGHAPNIVSGEFLLWGNDNATLTPSGNVPAGYNQRLLRVWKVQETGETGALTVTFDLANVPGVNLAAINRFALLVDADGDFSNATVIPGGVVNGSQITFSGINPSNGQFFSLAYPTLITTGPGGINAAIALWLKANAGVSPTVGTVTNWADQTGTNIFTLNGNPQIGASTVNYNPVVTFDGNGDYLVGDTPITFTEAFLAGNQLTSAGRPLAGDGTVPGGCGAYFFSQIGGPLYAGDANANYLVTNGNDPGGYRLLNSTLAGVAGPNNSRTAINGADQPATLSAGPLQPFYRVPLVGICGNRDVATTYNGSLGEVIVYTTALNNTDRLKVNSYLAIKYGVTLSPSLNYVDSANTIVWNGSVNTAYYNDVAGIGRDDLSLLDQRRSAGINNDAFVVISTTAFSADRSFLLWGNNNLTTTLNTIAGAYNHMARIWKVQETGTVNTTTVSLPAAYNAKYLLVDADGDFSSGAKAIALSAGGGNLTAAYNFSNGQFFTFGNDAPNLQAIVTYQPTPPQVGFPATFTLQISNTGGPATGAVLTFTVPPSATVGPLPAGCMLNSGLIICGPADVPGPGSVTYTPVSVTPTVSGAQNITTTVGVPGQAPATTVTSVTVLPAPNLIPIITYQPNPPQAGFPTTFTLQISNTGGPTTGGYITLTVPPSATVGSPLPAGCVLNGGFITCGPTSVPGPGSVTYTPVVVTLSVSGSQGITVTVDGEGVPPATTVTSVTVLPPPSLTPIVSYQPNPPQVGFPTTFTLQISNTGGPATGATVTFTVPPSATVGPLPAGCVLNGGLIICGPTNVPGPGSVTYTPVVVTATVPGSQTLTTTVGAPGVPPTSTTTNINVLPAPNLTPIITYQPNPPQAGFPTTFTLQISNTGGPATGALITLTVPPSATVGLPLPAGCVLNGGFITCGPTSVPGPGSVTYTPVVVTLTVAGSQGITVTVDGEGVPPTTTVTPVTVLPAPNLTPVITYQPNPPQVGNPTTFTLQISNTGGPATGAFITLTVPPSATVGLPLPAGCVLNGGFITCGPTNVPGPGSVTYTPVVVTLTVAGSQGITVTVDGEGVPPTTTVTPVTVLPAPSITPIVTYQPNPPQVGNPTTFTLQISNTGGPATGALVTFTVPPSAVVGSPLPAGCALNGSLIVCGPANVPGPGTVTYTPVVVTFTATGVQTLTTTLTAQGVPPTSTNTVINVVNPATPIDPNGLAVTSNSPVLIGTPSVVTATAITGTQPITFTWNFSGNLQTGSPATYTYPLPGVYTVILTATNAAGFITRTVTITVSPYAADAAFARQWIVVQSPARITYTLIVTNLLNMLQTNVILSGSMPLSTTLLWSNTAFSSTTGGDFNSGYVTSAPLPVLGAQQSTSISWSIGASRSNAANTLANGCYTSTGYAVSDQAERMSALHYICRILFSPIVKDRTFTGP